MIKKKDISVFLKKGYICIGKDMRTKRRKEKKKKEKINKRKKVKKNKT